MLLAPLLLALVGLCAAGKGKPKATTSALTPCVTAPADAGPAPAGTFPNPEPCTGNCSAYEDQAVVLRRSDGLYFRFAFDVNSHNDALFTAPSLGGPWEFVTGEALPQVLQSQYGTEGVPWAPQVAYIGGEYVVFYTDHYVRSTSNTNHAEVIIAYATSPTMEPGSYTNRGTLNIPYEHHVYSQISPAFLNADPPILIFGSDSQGMYYVNLTIDMPTIQTNPTVNATAQEMISAQLRPCNFHRNLTQDPFLYQHPNGYTYAFFTNGLNFPGRQATYPEFERIEVCRSKNPHWGYVNAEGRSCLEPGEQPTGTLVIQSHGDNVLGPGSPAVVDAPGVGPYLIYQYGDPSKNSTHGSTHRLYGHNFMDFSSGWPVLVANNANTTVTNTTSPSSTSAPSYTSTSSSTATPSSTSTHHNGGARYGYSGIGIAVAVAVLLFANI